MAERRRSVAVVGGGPAGLAAAWRLAEVGCGVRVYEAASRVGGGFRTDAVAGRGADVAVQLLSSDYTAALGLLNDMGLADRMVPSPGRDALWRDGRVHPLRYGSMRSMAASGALPAGLKIRLGLRYAPFLERRAGTLDLNDPGAADRLHTRTIADWGAAEMGIDFVEWLAYPLLSAYYSVTPEETSAGFFHALARSGMGVEVVGARGGFGALAADMSAALARRGVEVRTDAAVRELVPSAGGVRIVTGDVAAEHEAVVVALPPGAAAALLPDLLPDLPLLAEARVRSTAVLVLATRRPVDTGWFGLSIPRTEPAGATLAAICVQAEKATDVVGPEGGSLVLVPSPPVGERWAAADPGEILDEAMVGLGNVLPEASADVIEARLVRLEDAVWLPGPDHFARLSAFRPASLPPWLALAGDYLVAPTVEGAVRSGLAAADRAALSVESA